MSRSISEVEIWHLFDSVGASWLPVEFSLVIAALIFLRWATLRRPS